MGPIKKIYPEPKEQPKEQPIATNYRFVVKPKPSYSSPDRSFKVPRLLSPIRSPLNRSTNLVVRAVDGKRKFKQFCLLLIDF